MPGPRGGGANHYKLEDETSARWGKPGWPSKAAAGSLCGRAQLKRRQCSTSKFSRIANLS